jgi:DNA repair protein RecN (Recombination protein N)
MEKSTFDTEFQVKKAERDDDAPVVNGMPVQHKSTVLIPSIS